MILYLCKFGVWIAGLFIPKPAQQLRIVLYLPIKTVLFYRKVGGIQFYPDIGPLPADPYWHWEMEETLTNVSFNNEFLNQELWYTPAWAGGTSY